MDENKINENNEIQNEKYEAYIIKIIYELKRNEDIKIKGKILHYLEKPVFYYICTFLSSSKNNPFRTDIEFGFEFIEEEIPYATILTDFVEPTLNDNRNFYYCLTKDYNYKFSLHDMDQHKVILESMIQGIGNFLTYLMESIAIKAFIFFGQYEYEHIYQINDFLQSGNYFEFYRINEINTKEERYIIFTNLYFLYFSPIESNKALAKLLFHQKLKDMNLLFDKNEKNNSLILKLSNTKYNNDIEFTLINRSREEEQSINLVEDEINEKEKIEKNEKEKKADYSILIKNWFSYVDCIDFKKYEIVLKKYKILFADENTNNIVKKKKRKNIEEYNKNIEFNEKVIALYEKKNNKILDKRLFKSISNIIYICSELASFADTKNGKGNEYCAKIRKYLAYNKKNKD